MRLGRVRSEVRQWGWKWGTEKYVKINIQAMKWGKVSNDWLSEAGWAPGKMLLWLYWNFNIIFQKCMTLLNHNIIITCCLYYFSWWYTFIKKKNCDWQKLVIQNYRITQQEIRSKVIIIPTVVEIYVQCH